MLTRIIFCLLSLNFLFCHGQNSEIRRYDCKKKNCIYWAYGTDADINQVENTKKLVYYGLDFSTFRLTLPSKVGQEKNLNKYLPAWIKRVHNEDEIVPEKHLKRWLKKDELIYSADAVQQRVKKTLTQEWIIFGEYKIGLTDESSLDSIKSIVRDYSLPEKSGIGLSVVLENFDVESGKITGYFVFFDIETKRILRCTKARSNNTGGGLTSQCGVAIIDLINEFIYEGY